MWVRTENLAACEKVSDFHLWTSHFAGLTFIVRTTIVAGTGYWIPCDYYAIWFIWLRYAVHPLTNIRLLDMTGQIFTLSVINVSDSLHPPTLTLPLSFLTLNHYLNRYTLRAPCCFQRSKINKQSFLFFYNSYTKELLFEHSFPKPVHFHK